MSPRRRHSLPDIFAHISYAAWLAQVFAALHAQDETFTHRSFSQMCGYRSSGAMSLVMSERRRLSEEGAQRVAKALGLQPAERDHLLAMVGLERASDFKSRAALLAKMRQARRFAEEWAGTLSAYDFYSQWYLPIVRELVSLPDFEEDPAWIKRRVHGQISLSQAREAIDELLRCGHLTRDEEGALRPTRPVVATHSELHSDALKQHQREMMRLASEALDTQEREVRDMRVMTCAISRAQAEKIKVRLTGLQKELLEIIAEDEPIEGVYQLNVQWFALTDTEEP